MQDINEISRIDKYTCKFENPVMEDQYMEAQWIRLKKILSFAIIFISIILCFDTFTAYERFGGFRPILIGFPILIGMTLSFFIFPESFKAKRHGLFIAVMVLLVHTYQVFQAIAIENAPEIDAITLLASIPAIFMFIGIMFPFNLITTVSLLIYLLATLLPAINFDSISMDVIVFTIPVPMILIIWNRYNNEYNNRLNFAKNVSIDQTKNLMQKTLHRYFGDVLSDKMLRDGGELEGENKWVTILFTDLNAYSTITENMSPEVALEFLNEYFTKMHEVIEKFNGHILNYIGDSIMVVFGAPEKLKDHENLAVKCSLKMKEKLVELNSEWDNNETSRYWKNHGIDSINMRIGIHTGNVIAGNLGSREMLQYSTIGDTVNVAARLEQANKDFNTEISFSHEIYTALTKELHKKTDLSGEITLKGRTAPTKVYSIKM